MPVPRFAAHTQNYTKRTYVIFASMCFYLMPRSHIHGSPRRIHYGLNLTDDPGNASFRSPIRMHNGVATGFDVSTNTPGTQFRLPCTPPWTIFHGCQIVHWDPLDGKRRCPQKNWFGLCEIAWFLCQPIEILRRGVCL